MALLGSTPSAETPALHGWSRVRVAYNVTRSLRRLILCSSHHDEEGYVSMSLDSYADESDKGDGDGIVRKRSSLRPEVLKALEVENRTAWQHTLAAASLAAYILIAAHDGLLKSWSKAGATSFPYHFGSVVLVVKLSSILLGVTLTAALEGGASAMQHVFSPRDLVWISLPSMAMAACQLLYYAALDRLPVETLAVAEKAQLILVALVSSLALGKQYTGLQWLALFGVSLSTAVFVSNASSGDKAASTVSDRAWEGWALFWISQVLSVFCGIAYEKMLKSAKRESYAVQKARMNVPAAVFTLAHVCWSGGLSFAGGDSGFFQGWDYRTVLVCVIVMLKAWLTTLLVKLLSTVALGLASTAAMLLVFLEARCFLGQDSISAAEAVSVAAVGSFVCLYVWAGSKPQAVRTGMSSLRKPLLPRSK